jgi:5-deoxy-glucuronate isomerase
MLNNTLIRSPKQDGLHQLYRRGERGLNDLSLSRLHLDPGGAVEYRNSDEESIVVLQEGRGTFRSGHESWPVSRRSVFDERASSLYLPPGTSAQITADTAMDAVVVSAPSQGSGAAVFSGPADVQVNARGRGGYGREVHDIFVRDPHARRIMLGETFNPPGHWSSFPPHKHDGRDGEPRLEEIYYFKINPTQGFGQQILYTTDGESVTHVVRDGDVVLLPYGYHPVAAAPGYQLYYLWAMVGDERKLALYEDPAHRWIHDAPVESV